MTQALEMFSVINMKKERAIEIYGSAANLAHALGITRSAVSQWKSGKNIPREHELRIRYELRPDLWPDQSHREAA